MPAPESVPPAWVMLVVVLVLLKSKIVPLAMLTPTRAQRVAVVEFDDGARIDPRAPREGVCGRERQGAAARLCQDAITTDGVGHGHAVRSGRRSRRLCR